MLCKKCQAEIQPGNSFCNECGTPVFERQKGSSDQKFIDVSTVMVIPGISWALTIVGCFLIILGCFLPWIAGTDYYKGALGVEIGQGTVTLMASVLCLAAFILASSDARWKRGIFFLVMGALILALVFQALYMIKEHDYSIGAGLWISMAGGFLVIGAGGSDAGVFNNIAVKSSHSS